MRSLRRLSEQCKLDHRNTFRRNAHSAVEEGVMGIRKDVAKLGAGWSLELEWYAKPSKGCSRSEPTLERAGAISAPSTASTGRPGSTIVSSGPTQVPDVESMPASRLVFRSLAS